MTVVPIFQTSSPNSSMMLLQPPIWSLPSSSSSMMAMSDDEASTSSTTPVDTTSKSESTTTSSSSSQRADPSSSSHPLFRNPSDDKTGKPNQKPKLQLARHRNKNMIGKDLTVHRRRRTNGTSSAGVKHKTPSMRRKQIMKPLVAARRRQKHMARSSEEFAVVLQALSAAPETFE